MESLFWDNQFCVSLTTLKLTLPLPLFLNLWLSQQTEKLHDLLACFGRRWKRNSFTISSFPSWSKQVMMAFLHPNLAPRPCETMRESMWTVAPYSTAQTSKGKCDNGSTCIVRKSKHFAIFEIFNYYKFSKFSDYKYSKHWKLAIFAIFESKSEIEILTKKGNYHHLTWVN